MKIIDTNSFISSCTAYWSGNAEHTSQKTQYVIQTIAGIFIAGVVATLAQRFPVLPTNITTLGALGYLSNHIRTSSFPRANLGVFTATIFYIIINEVPGSILLRDITILSAFYLCKNYANETDVLMNRLESLSQRNTNLEAVLRDSGNTVSPDLTALPSQDGSMLLSHIQELEKQLLEAQKRIAELENERDNSLGLARLLNEGSVH